GFSRAVGPKPRHCPRREPWRAADASLSPQPRQSGCLPPAPQSSKPENSSHGHTRQAHRTSTRRLFRPPRLKDSRIPVILPHPPHTLEDQFLLYPRNKLLRLYHLVRIHTHTNRALSHEKLYDLGIVRWCLAADGRGN